MFGLQFLLQKERTELSELRLASLALKGTVLMDRRIHGAIFPLLQFPEEVPGGQEGSYPSLIISLVFRPLGGWAHTSMLRPGPPLPQLCLSSSHALSLGLTRLP